MNKGAAKNWIRSRKNWLILAIGALGILLLFLSEMPSFRSDKSSDSELKQSDWQTVQTDMEKRLTQMVQAVDGAGKAMVLLTPESDGEQTYAADRKSQSEISEKTTQYSLEESYVLVGGSNGEGLLVKSEAPRVRGVAVVCEGGGDAGVRREITEMICAALGIGRDQIYVAKMNPEK